MTWILSRAFLQAHANSHCSQAVEEESSVGTFLDGIQCAPLSGSPTHSLYWCNDKTTESLPHSLFGMTCKHLTAQDGEELLMSYLAGSRVRTSAAPAKAPVSPVRVLDFGVTWRGLLTRYDHEASLWRTRPSLWDEGLTLSLPTLPRWGLMHDGALWERVTLARPTYDTESGSLPTPVKYDSHGTWESNNYHGLGWSAKHAPETLQKQTKQAREGTWPTPMTTGMRGGSGVPVDLQERLHTPKRVKLWPTPVKNEDRAAKYTPETSWKHFSEGTHQVHLAQAVRDVRMFPTPAARDGHEKQAKKPPERVRLTASGLPEADRPSGSGKQLSLAQAANVANDRKRVRVLPTPTSANGLRGGGHGASSEHRPGKWQSPGHPEYGELSPDWVEWIMGWPIGWTSLEPMSRDAWNDWVSGQAGSANGLPTWWLNDPSDEPGSGIQKTVIVDAKESEARRVARIAALGNGQVPAVVVASVTLLGRIPMPDGLSEKE